MVALRNVLNKVPPKKCEGNHHLSKHARHLWLRPFHVAATASWILVSTIVSASPPNLPLEITPEGVKELERKGLPYVLVESNEAGLQGGVEEPGIRVIYYTQGPDHRAARERALVDRNLSSVKKSDGKDKKKAPTFGAIARPDSQRLTGTPLDWEQLALPLQRRPVPDKPLVISPRALANAINDEVDLQIIDLRPGRFSGATAPLVGEIVPFPGALTLLPHEVQGAALSKRR